MGVRQCNCAHSAASPAQYRVTQRPYGDGRCGATSCCRNGVFVVVAPGEHDEGGEGADRAYGDHPPDVPDQGKTHDGGEKTRRRSRSASLRGISIARYSGFSSEPNLLGRPFFELPKGVLAGYLG